MIDWSKAKYSSNDGTWFLYLSQEELLALWGEQPATEGRFFSRLKPRTPQERYQVPLEVIVAGDEERSQNGHFPFVEKAVLQLRDLAQEAEEYLKAFLDLSKIKNSTGDICIQAMEFGMGKSAEVGQFEMSMTLNKDNYGQWTVGFAYAAQPPFERFIPIHFARTQM